MRLHQLKWHIQPLTAPQLVLIAVAVFMTVVAGGLYGPGVVAWTRGKILSEVAYASRPPAFRYFRNCAAAHAAGSIRSQAAHLATGLRSTPMTTGLHASPMLGVEVASAAVQLESKGRTMSEGRRSASGLPPDAVAYKRTAEFTADTVPAGLLRAHSTKGGVWGLIHVLEGRLAYRIADPRRPASEVILTPSQAPGLVEPTVLHEVEPLGPVRFYVEFHRRTDAAD